MNAVAALLFIITIINLFLGALFFLRNHRNSLYISLSLFIFLVAGWMFSMGGFYQTENITDSFWWIKATYIFGIVIANTLVYFSLIFPKGKSTPLWQGFLVYIPAIPLIVAILMVPDFLFKEIVSYGWWKDVRLGTIEHTLYTIYFITVYFGAIAILLKKFLSSSGRIKLQVAYALYAVFIAGTFGAIFDLLFPWIGLYKYIWLGPLGTLVMVGVFIYAIVKHRFLDIRLIVARAIAYLLLIFILATIYSVGLFVAGTLLVELTFSIPSLVISTVLALIIAFSFQPLRGFLEHITDRIFYRGHYNSNVLLSQLSTIMSFNIELYNLCHEVLDALIKQMKISRGAFVILGEGLVSIYDVVEIGFYNEAHKGNLTYGQISAFLPFGNILVFDELAENHLKNLMRELDVSIVKTLTVKNQVMGVLLLGEKASGEIYSEQDLKMLEILAPEVSVAIQNSLSYDKIKKFNVILSEEVKRATADLQNANQRLRNLDQLKDEFVSVASHELRTPMTAIRSYAWMVLNKADVPLSEKVKKYLVRVLMSTERLIHLVNDMLNISRIESGRIEITPEPVDLLALTRDVVDEVYYSKSQEKTLHFEVLEKPVPKAFADPEKLRQVLLNLVGNSLKFTPAGGKISFDFFSDGQTVEITVKDSGVGIAKEDLGRLFQKFGRLDSSYVAAASSGGTGLGLYIAKSLIDLMHGRIWARSEGRGQGASFTISLPTATEDKIKNALYYTIKARGGAKGLEPAAL